VFQLTLDHFGIAEADVERWGGALVPARSYDEQLALYTAGSVNALWQFMGIPSPSIEAANALCPLRPLAFSEDLIAALERLGWTPATFPIVRVVCEQTERVRRIHAAAAGFDPADAHRLARGPLHAGATRYFREAGVLA
jgi:TRAP-type uncharacterized transport system substrate-binding protein